MLRVQARTKPEFIDKIRLKGFEIQEWKEAQVAANRVSLHLRAGAPKLRILAQSHT